MRSARRRMTRWRIAMCSIFKSMGRVAVGSKRHIRMRMFQALTKQTKEDRRRKSEVIWRKLARLAVFRRARTVLCYVALPYEVDTWSFLQRMLESGKRVVVPRVAGRRLALSQVRDLTRDLAPGAFGVWEPKPAITRPVPRKALDVALVPGLAFDRRGHRLGHGGGYFDRLLASLPPTTTTVGLCFRFQLLDRLPISSHDHAVQTVLAA